MFNTISGKHIAMFGFAFKKNTGDTRETPAIDVAKYLLAERAVVSIYDPKVEHEQIKYDFKEYKVLEEGIVFDDFVKLPADPYEAAKGAHSICVMTEWDEFKNYDYQKMYDSMQKPSFIFDGRNILDHAKLEKIGFTVYSIGKPTATSVNMDK